MKGVCHLCSAMMLLSMLRTTTEKAISQSPDTDVDEYGEDMDPDILMTEEYLFSYRGTTMLPRYLQLGNQTVDLNKLFKVPQDNENENRNSFDEDNNNVKAVKSREEDFITEIANNHRHSGSNAHSGHGEGHNGHTGSSNSHSGSSNGHSVGSNGHSGGSNGHSGSSNGHSGSNGHSAHSNSHSISSNGHGGGSNTHSGGSSLTHSHGVSSNGHSGSSLSGHSGSVHSQLDQMPWLKARPQHEHDRRHGPHFEDASSDNSSVTVQAGHTAHFDCRVSMLRDKTVSWVRRKTGEPPLLLTVGDQTYTGDSRFSVQFRYPGNWRLRLTAVNKSDDGLYECQLSTHPPNVIRVYLRVDAPEVSIVDESGAPLREQYYEIGSTLYLRCVVRGGPTVSGTNAATVWWLHGQRALHRDATRGGVAVKTEAGRRGSAESTLRVSKLGPADAGNYTCALPPARAYTVLVHVLNEESLAELQQGSSTSGPPTLLILLTAVVFALGACS